MNPGMTGETDRRSVVIKVRLAITDELQYMLKWTGKIYQTQEKWITLPM